MYTIKPPKSIKKYSMKSTSSIPTYSIQSLNQFNLSESVSDIHMFVDLYKQRVKKSLDSDNVKSPFVYFAEGHIITKDDLAWLEENKERYFNDTLNDVLVTEDYLSECGFITSMVFSPDGELIIVGHSSGLIQSILSDYSKRIHEHFEYDNCNEKAWYPMFSDVNYATKGLENFDWVTENEELFLKNTKNKFLYQRWLFSESGDITAMQYSSSGFHIIVGYSSGLIEMRHGSTGTVLYTLRNIQFPPKPVFALEYSPYEENICYAACSDGAVYRIEIPRVDTSLTDPPTYCIKADPMLESLNTQFYGTPGISSCSTPYITQRYPALSVGLMADQKRIAVGYSDGAIKIYDMETQEAEITYKVHKLRLQFIPKKLQRIHFGQVVSLRTHTDKPYMFASGAWDKTLRIWDVRCKVGCVMTFEGVDICNDSIDLNREHCLVGSWLPTEALTLWDLGERKRLAIIRAQNRRHDVDGEYIYACRYWRSNFNRKGKYGIIGGSGTKCLEVINLHNRYIACSYPTKGTILAVTSYGERIAFGGTSSVFTIVEFHEPKHEREAYKPPLEPDFDYAHIKHLFPVDGNEITASISGSISPFNQSQRHSSSTMASIDPEIAK